MSGSYWWRSQEGYHRAFRPVRGRYAPVAGGRWFVRRWLDARSKTDGKVWHAWSSGRASKFNRRFLTHAEAVDWAQRAATAYKLGDESELLVMYYEKHPPKLDGRVVREYSGVLL